MYLVEATNMIDFPLLAKTEDFENLLKSHVRRVIIYISYLSQLEPKNLKGFGFIEVLMPNVSGTEKEQLFNDGCLFLEAF